MTTETTSAMKGKRLLGERSSVLVAALAEHDGVMTVDALIEATKEPRRPALNALYNMTNAGYVYKDDGGFYRLTGKGYQALAIYREKGPKAPQGSRKTRKVKTPRTPRIPSHEDITPGSMLEMVGSLKNGTPVARVIDTGRLYKIEAL